MTFAQYEEINNALSLLKIYRIRLTPQQYKTPRGQALAGDPEGAIKGLKKLLRKGGYL